MRHLGVEIDDALEIAQKIDVRCTWGELPCSARQHISAKECQSLPWATESECLRRNREFKRKNRIVAAFPRR